MGQNEPVSEQLPSNLLLTRKSNTYAPGMRPTSYSWIQREGLNFLQNLHTGEKKYEHLDDQAKIIILSWRARMQGGLLGAVSCDTFVGSWKKCVRSSCHYLLNAGHVNRESMQWHCSAETLEEVSASINKSKLKSWNYEKTRGQLLIYGVEGHRLELFDAFIFSLSPLCITSEWTAGGEMNSKAIRGKDNCTPWNNHLICSCCTQNYKHTH